MRAIDAAQLIVNRMNRTDHTIARDDLLKVLYLLDDAIFKESGKHLVDEKFTFNSNGPFIEDVYKHFTLWNKDDYSYRTAQVKHNLGEKDFNNLNKKIYELGRRGSWELNAMVCNHLNKGKRKILNSNTIASYNSVNDEILDRCRIMLELVKTRVEFRDYHKIGLQTSVPDDLYWLTKLDRDNIYFSIKEQDDGNFKMNWCSYDTLDGYGDEEAIVPSDFINNFDEYYNKIKDEIEANNEIEKVKFAEYQAKQKLEALEAKQKEIEKMEAKLQADKAKIDQLRKNLSNSGIEL